MPESHLTRRHPSALDIISRVLEAFHAECTGNPLATISETHLKVVAMNALLISGYALLEGGAKASVNKKLSLSGGRIAVEEVPRRTPDELLKQVYHKLEVFKAKREGREVTPPKRTSADIRVHAPCKLVLELQTRCVYGSQDTLVSDNLLDDLERLVTGRADVFVMACDAPIYHKLLGRRDGRGRKPKLDSAMARAIFPSVESLPFLQENSEVRENTTGTHFGTLHLRGCRTLEGVAVERVILAIWSSEPSPSLEPPLELAK
jgi:hypothetical protein